MRSAFGALGILGVVGLLGIRLLGVIVELIMLGLFDIVGMIVAAGLL